MAADPFNLGGGLADFHGEVTDALFKFDDAFTNDDGEPVCLLELTLSSEELEDDITKLYTCGPNWEPSADGKRAVRADDPDNDTANFNGGTKVGRLITTIVTNGAADVIRDRYLNEGIGATDAAMFVGLKGLWGQVKYEWKFNGEKGESEFLGLKEFDSVAGNGSKPKKSTAKKAPAKKAPAKAAAPKAKVKAKAEAAEDETNTSGGLSAEQIAAVKAIYDEIETPDQFLERVVDEVDGITDHLDYITDLENGAWDDLVEGKI